MSETREGFPLSPQQRRLWEAGGREAGTPFMARCAVRITGQLDLQAALRAVTRTVERHEVLRTSFHVSADMTFPLQVIGAGTPSAAIELTPIGPSEHSLVMRFPALCCDRRGLENLIGEICRAYDTGAEPPEPPLQYADAAAWLNDAAAAEEGAAGREFWQRQGDAHTPRLPFEHEPAEGTFSPRAVMVGRVPAGPDGAPAARSEWLTLACWTHLLQRLADAAPITMAIELDGRSYAELEAAVGLYARTVPLPRIDTIETSAEEAGAVLAAAVTEAAQWSEVFDWRLADRRAGDTGVPFAFEIRRPAPVFDAGGVRFTVGECESPIDRFHLKLVHQAAVDGGAGLALHFDASRYSAQSIEDLGTHLRTLLAAAAARPAEALRTVSLLDRISAASRVPEPTDRADAARCIHHLFEDRVRASRERIAVTCEGHDLTYGQVNARANQLAHRLKRLGVLPDTVVGLCLPRSTDLIVAALGILKAGAGYLPLDPKLPAGRLELMANSAGASLVVTDAATRQQRAVGSAVLLDDAGAPLAAEPEEDPVTAVEPAHLAYVLFTSGSTGQPKGVAVEHRQLWSYVEAARQRLELPDGASYATVTTMAADLGHTSIFPALTSGGRLHIVTEERASDAAAFAGYCAQHAIDVLKIVPSHLRALLTVSAPASILPRQRLILGGEACPWDLVDLVRGLAPACRIFNHYGPTETTVGAAAFEVTTGRQPADGPTVPIGRALDNAATYVLDPAGHPVPEWFTGELFIGGHGVARGYVNARADADSPFMPDVFTSGGTRMYRTGDRVRLRPGRVLEFLGRIDDQIKIRGFRVEPGEIEATLRTRAAVRDASVIVKRGDGAAALIAAVASADTAESPAAIEMFLRTRLPDYMVPATIVVVAEIPRNANGKADRPAIEALASRPLPRALDREEILGEWEQSVATLWQELLGVDDVRPHDNFYDLGGHSLLAIQTVTALERRLGVKVAARDLVFHTLRQFAALCQTKASARA